MEQWILTLPLFCSGSVCMMHGHGAKKEKGRMSIYSRGKVAAEDESRYLDSIELARLERIFFEWMHQAKRRDTKHSRMRICMIFVLVRYTGGKLSEVLSIDPFPDIDFEQKVIVFAQPKAAPGRSGREVPVPENAFAALKPMMSDPGFTGFLKKSGLSVDPGFVRRKFYERARACGIEKERASPEAIRKSRAAELMMNNLPLPAIQSLMGLSAPGRTAAQVNFSEDDIRQVIRLFMEKEAYRKTSARNAFFGKIMRITKGDIQAVVELSTINNETISTVITNGSLSRLGLAEGKIIAAEVKAPWVIVHKSAKEPACSAENRFSGTVTRIRSGEINTEYVIRISDDTELCAIVNTDRARVLDIRERDSVWAVFNANSVVLHLD